MSIKLRAAKHEEKPQLRAMLSVYLEELSQYGDVDLEYPFLDSYWEDEARWAYFIDQCDVTTGFTLINTWSPSKKGTDFSVAEFCVLPKFRSAGIGRHAFIDVLDCHRGTWEISVMKENKAGNEFWGRAIAAAGVTAVERLEVEDALLVYRFTTGH